MKQLVITCRVNCRVATTEFGAALSRSGSDYIGPMLWVELVQCGPTAICCTTGGLLHCSGPEPGTQNSHTSSAQHSSSHSSAAAGRKL